MQTGERKNNNFPLTDVLILALKELYGELRVVCNSEDRQLAWVAG